MFARRAQILRETKSVSLRMTKVKGSEIMNLSNIHAPKKASEKRKRVGRGMGSGMGKTSTRGHKGPALAHRLAHDPRL